MILIGLTGSIGMGKTATTAMFAEAGVPVYDADVAVHAAYSPGGAAVEPVGAAFPGVVRDGAVDRAALSTRVTGDAAALRRLEAVVHPLLGRHRAEFLSSAEASGARAALLDVPLLFETGGDAAMDAVVVVSAPQDVQRRRVLARAGMDEAKLDTLLARQLADAEKRARADFVIETGQGFEHARRQVGEVLSAVLAPGWRPVRPRGGSI